MIFDRVFFSFDSQSSGSAVSAARTTWAITSNDREAILERLEKTCRILDGFVLQNLKRRRKTRNTGKFWQLSKMSGTKIRESTTWSIMNSEIWRVFSCFDSSDGLITEYVKRRNFCENTTLKSITCEICKIACKRQDKSEFVFFFCQNLWNHNRFWRKKQTYRNEWKLWQRWKCEWDR